MYSRDKIYQHFVTNCSFIKQLTHFKVLQTLWAHKKGEKINYKQLHSNASRNFVLLINAAANNIR